MFLEISFTKKDNAVWVSHRDIIDYFGRLFKRAALPVEYTEGFTPRPKIIFALPLSVGSEGIGELLIVKISKDSQGRLGEFISRLNEKSAPGIKIDQCSFCSDKKDFFNSLDKVCYTFSIPPGEKIKSEITKLTKIKQLDVHTGKKNEVQNIAPEILDVRTENLAFSVFVPYRQNGVVTEKHLREVIKNVFEADAEDWQCTRKILKK